MPWGKGAGESLCNETHFVIPSTTTTHPKDASTTLNMVINVGTCKIWLIFDNHQSVTHKTQHYPSSYQVLDTIGMCDAPGMYLHPSPNLKVF